jgi:putative 2OG-Fe(II) oxygenase
MNSKIVAETLRRNGFANGGPIAYTAGDEFAELAGLVKSVYAGLPDGHPDRLQAALGTEGCRRVPEHHPRITALLDQVLTTPAIREVLDDVLGDGYRIWQINHRRSAPGDPGLYLHQDAVGEFNMVLMLSDNPSGDGATIFLPGSHRIPRRMIDLQVAVPPKLIALTTFLFAPLKGRCGDVGFFFNRTWHGRFANHSSNAFDVLLVSFFPADASAERASAADSWSAEFRSVTAGTAIGNLIDPPATGPARHAGRPFVLAIEDLRDWPGAGLRASVAFLKAMMAVLQPVSRLVRAVTGAGTAGR